MMKKLFLFFSLLISSLLCNALSLQEYRKFIDAIEQGNEAAVIELKNTYELSTSEKEKLSAFAKQVILGWQLTLDRTIISPYDAIPEIIKKKISPDFVQKFAGWTCILSLAGYPTIFIINLLSSIDRIPGSLPRLAYWLNGAITISTYIAWRTRIQNKINRYKEIIEQGYNTAHRIQLLIEA